MSYPCVPTDGPIAVKPRGCHFVGEGRDLGSVHDMVPSPVDFPVCYCLPRSGGQEGVSGSISHFLHIGVMPVARR